MRQPNLAGRGWVLAGWEAYPGFVAAAAAVAAGVGVARMAAAAAVEAVAAPVPTAAAAAEGRAPAAVGAARGAAGPAETAAAGRPQVLAAVSDWRVARRGLEVAPGIWVGTCAPRCCCRAEKEGGGWGAAAGTHQAAPGAVLAPECGREVEVECDIRVWVGTGVPAAHAVTALRVQALLAVGDAAPAALGWAAAAAAARLGVRGAQGQGGSGAPLSARVQLCCRCRCDPLPDPDPAPGRHPVDCGPGLAPALGPCSPPEAGWALGAPTQCGGRLWCLCRRLWRWWWRCPPPPDPAVPPEGTARPHGPGPPG